MAAGTVAAGVVLGFAWRRVGGFTGDVLGAAGILGETVGLLVASARGDARGPPGRCRRAGRPGRRVPRRAAGVAPSRRRLRDRDAGAGSGGCTPIGGPPVWPTRPPGWVWAPRPASSSGSTTVATYLAVAGRALREVSAEVAVALEDGDLQLARRLVPSLVGR